MTDESTMGGERRRVLVLMGGPDAERGVSLDSGYAVAAALREAGYDVRAEVIDRPTAAELRALCAHHGVINETPGDEAGEVPGVVFPALHGLFGEGGELQRLLESAGAAFVGAGSHGSRLAIDKFATKQIAAALLEVDADADDEATWACCGVGVSPTWLLHGRDDEPPAPLPLVVKPNFEGSTVGLHLCRDAASWSDALAAVRTGEKAMIAEPLIDGMELTIGLMPRGDGTGELDALPMIHVEPANGVYDFEAKYTREDTAYRFDAAAEGLSPEALAAFTRRLATRLGVRHLARADFIFDRERRAAWFLEVNTMPGFTSHSLLPMAAARAGVSFGELCSRLVETASLGPRVATRASCEAGVAV
jgi:D-alanine-D-alanine ligase